MVAGLGGNAVAQSVQSELLVEPGRQDDGDGECVDVVVPGFAGGLAVLPWP